MVDFTCVSSRPKMFLPAVPSLIARRPLPLAPTAAARPLGGLSGESTPLVGLIDGENPLTALMLAAVRPARTAGAVETDLAARTTLDLGFVGAVLLEGF